MNALDQDAVTGQVASKNEVSNDLLATNITQTSYVIKKRMNVSQPNQPSPSHQETTLNMSNPFNIPLQQHLTPGSRTLHKSLMNSFKQLMRSPQRPRMKIWPENIGKTFKNWYKDSGPKQDWKLLRAQRTRPTKTKLPTTMLNIPARKSHKNGTMSCRLHQERSRNSVKNLLS